jgi:hypothetical protein
LSGSSGQASLQSAPEQSSPPAPALARVPALPPLPAEPAEPPVPLVVPAVLVLPETAVKVPAEPPLVAEPPLPPPAVLEVVPAVLSPGSTPLSLCAQAASATTPRAAQAATVEELRNGFEAKDVWTFIGTWPRSGTHATRRLGEATFAPPIGPKT